jgi:hypothetical protein
MAKQAKRKALLILGLLGVGVLSVFQSVVSLGSAKKDTGAISYSDLQGLLTVQKASADGSPSSVSPDPASCPASPSPCSP